MAYPKKASAVLDFLTPSLLIPIEQIPLGARIPTKNPKPWEYDDSLPEPDQSTWAKISITMHRNDGGIVDAELLRPRWWIAQHNIVAGKLLPINIEELQVKGSAFVTAVDKCPEIASGEGSVVTARFITREVNTIARAEIIGPDGTIETISGTPIHPVWSIDRNDWVPLGELTEGETLQSSNGVATILSLALVTCSLPVYNIEVHGEHVYQVGELGLLVHNTCPVSGGKTVLGHYPAYTELAEQLGARRFNIPTSVWDKMTEAERWAANTKFLNRMITHGDDIILATRADLAKPSSYFARELEYLLSKGFKLSEDGLRLIPPGAH